MAKAVIEDRTDPRTYEEAVLDVKYQVLSHALHARLIKRSRYLLSIATIFAGTAAFGLFLREHPDLLRWAGLATALLTILNFVLDLPTKQASHLQFAAQYAKLSGRVRDLTLDAIDKELSEIGITDTAWIDAVSRIAYNRNVIAAGRDSYARKLPIGDRILGLFV